VILLVIFRNVLLPGVVFVVVPVMVVLVVFIVDTVLTVVVLGLGSSHNRAEEFAGYE
jgi:hypothetical protein